MSSKKKKGTSPWVHCENCLSYMVERDASIHINCPSNTFTHPYAQIGNLHCVIEYLNEKDIKGSMLLPEHLDSVIFISNAALQLCEIAIGSWVVISLVSGDQFVRKAWKGHDRVQLGASMVNKDIEAKSDGPASIALLKESVELAIEIVVDAEHEILRDFDISTYLQHAYKNHVFKIGNKIAYTYYGKPYTFLVKNISGSSQDSGCTFYQSAAYTQWIVNNARSNELPDDPSIVASEEHLEEIDVTLANAMSNTPSKGWIARGILIHGISGTGKSLLMKEVARKWGKKVIDITNINLNEDISAFFDSILQRARTSATAIITIDDLDAICGKSAGGSDSKEGFALASLFDRLHDSNAKIAILATTNNVNGVSRCLRRPGRFDKEIEIGPPTPQDRLRILKSLLKDNKSTSDSDVKSLADQAHGFVGADLSALVSKAGSLAAKDNSDIYGSHLRKAFPLIRPTAMREIMVQVPNVKWDDVGGNSQLKLQLRQAVEWPLKFPESFKRLGVSPPRGLLMYGPPGCSKTLIAKALATESGLNFFSVKGPELFSCWVGDSEKAVREVFRRARQAAPAIVFFDELDALAGERTGSQTGGSQVQERVLAQLLTELDGVEALGEVIVVGATNRPDRIDPALLRPGRLDRVVYVPLPDEQTRRDIFNIQFRKTPIATDVDLSELVLSTEGYSGAEVVGVCREAAMIALSQDLTSSVVSRNNFIDALKIITPRTTKSSLVLCEKYKNMRLL